MVVLLSLLQQPFSYSYNVLHTVFPYNIGKN